MNAALAKGGACSLGREKSGQAGWEEGIGVWASWEGGGEQARKQDLEGVGAGSMELLISCLRREYQLFAGNCKVNSLLPTQHCHLVFSLAEGTA